MISSLFASLSKKWKHSIYPIHREAILKQQIGVEELYVGLIVHFLLSLPPVPVVGYRRPQEKNEWIKLNLDLSLI